jgi:hypothetical protein
MKIFCRLTTWTILSAYNKICLVVLVSLPSIILFFNPIVNPADILSVNGIPNWSLRMRRLLQQLYCTTVLSKRSKRCTELITDLILVVFLDRDRNTSVDFRGVLISEGGSRSDTITNK